MKKTIFNKYSLKQNNTTPTHALPLNQKERENDLRTYSINVPVRHAVTEPPVEKEVQAELKKESIKNEKAMEKKLDTLLDKSQKILFTAKSVFPFDLFPDTLSIDINQVHVTINEFIRSKREHSISIKDISDAFVESSPWYATLKIVDKEFIESSIRIGFLKRAEAIKAKRIIHGLILGLKDGIDFSRIKDDKLVDKLLELGTPADITENKEQPVSSSA